MAVVAVWRGGERWVSGAGMGGWGLCGRRRGGKAGRVSGVWITGGGVLCLYFSDFFYFLSAFMNHTFYFNLSLSFYLSMPVAKFKHSCNNEPSPDLSWPTLKPEKFATGSKSCLLITRYVQYLEIFFFKSFIL